jgi:methionyl-tRNA synthetase
LFVHDYLTVDGAKISKSIGNGVSPAQLVERFGCDAVRWWLLSESPLGADTDFTVDRLVRQANDDLANGLGNLVSRTVALVHRLRGGRVIDTSPTDDDCAEREFHAALDAFDLRRAARVIRELVDGANIELERVRPWELARTEPDDDRIDQVLAVAVARCRRASALVGPFVPATAAAAARRLGSGGTVGEPGHVFDRLGG